MFSLCLSYESNTHGSWTRTPPLPQDITDALSILYCIFKCNRNFGALLHWQSEVKWENQFLDCSLGDASIKSSMWSTYLHQNMLTGDAHRGLPLLFLTHTCLSASDWESRTESRWALWSAEAGVTRTSAQGLVTLPWLQGHPQFMLHSSTLCQAQSDLAQDFHCVPAKLSHCVPESRRPHCWDQVMTGTKT